jgi:hypothetical protein
MLLTQGVVHLVLEWNVRMHLAKPDRRRVHFHIRRYQRSADRGHGASGGFCVTTEEAVPALSFEILFGRVPNLSEQDLRHHSLIFVIEEMTVKERHAANDRISKIHDQIH